MSAERCDSVYLLADGVLLRCVERYGHLGIHLTDVEINGVQCSTGWRDSEAAFSQREAVSPTSERQTT